MPEMRRELAATDCGGSPATRSTPSSASYRPLLRRRGAAAAVVATAMLLAAAAGCEQRGGVHKLDPTKLAATCPSHDDAELPPAAPTGDTGRGLWVDIESRGGACADDRARADVTKAAPWCTLGPAGTRARPGDIVHVRGGTYSTATKCDTCKANAVLQVTVGGRPDAWISYRAMRGETVRIVPTGGTKQGISIRQPVENGMRPRFIEVSGFTVRDAEKNCVEVKDTADVIVRDLELSGCGSGALELHRTARVTVEANRIHDNRLAGWTSALDLFLCGPGHVVRGNRIWSNRDADERRSEGHGITMDFCKQCGGALIENNLIWDNDGWCMAIFVSDGATVRNNTCWRNGRKLDGSGEISLLGSRHSAHNNIMVPSAGAPALLVRDRNDDWASDWTTLAIDANLMWSPEHADLVRWYGKTRNVDGYRSENPRGWGTAALGVNPRLVDPAGADFRPTAGSPVIDSGDTEHAAAIDIDGRARPRDGTGDERAVVDRGAHEQ